ncbi:hypothetical protein BDF22DRAFT_739526 [Syncephalis plumigaleata]|nr:hypothetical protein BDF22DRAFT_739526 [Syncephalis plumigaleata]
MYGLVALTGIALLIHRWRYIWLVEKHTSSTRFIRRPVDWMIIHFTWCSLVRSIHGLLLVLDVMQSYAIRQLLLSLASWGYLWALGVFLAGVVEAVFLVLRQTSFKTNMRWYRRADKSRDTRQYLTPTIGGIPKHTLLERSILFIVALILAVIPCGATALAYMAGLAIDVGDWHEYEQLDQFTWIVWTIGILCLSLLASIYLGSLTSVLRQSTYCLRLSAASFDADMSHQLIWLIKLMVVFYISSALTTIIRLCLFSTILSQLYASIAYYSFFNVFWWPFLTLAIFIVVGQKGKQKTPQYDEHSVSQVALGSPDSARLVLPQDTMAVYEVSQKSSNLEGTTQEIPLTHTPWSTLFDQRNMAMMVPTVPVPVRKSSLSHESFPASPISVTMVIEKSAIRRTESGASSNYLSVH